MHTFNSYHEQKNNADAKSTNLNNFDIAKLGIYFKIKLWYW